MHRLIAILAIGCAAHRGAISPSPSSTGSASIRGRVALSLVDDPKPLSGAQVRLHSSSSRPLKVAYTDTDGYYVIGDVAPALYTVLFCLQGKSFLREDVPVEPTRTTPIFLYLKESDLETAAPNPDCSLPSSPRPHYH